MDKMDGMVKIKPKGLYWWCSSYSLSKVIVDNRLEDLCRRENSNFLSSPTTISPLARIQDRHALN